MDYSKFYRTNAVIELIGDVLAAVWAVINIFISDSYVAAPLIPMMAGQIIKNIREIVLTGRDDYKQEKYLTSYENSYKDNRTLNIFKALLSLAVVLLVIIKLIIRQVSI
ncbi:MAG: hypothetical protein K2J73_09125 [Oscillospiraceae bacterium]|nr:hypothetical protein [Oscillospiraceae bacterium]